MAAILPLIVIIFQKGENARRFASSGKEIANLAKQGFPNRQRVLSGLLTAVDTDLRFDA